MRLILFVLPFLFCLPSTYAAEEALASYALTAPSTTTLKALAPHFGLEHRRGNVFELIVAQSQVPLLLSLAPDARLVESDTGAAAKSRLLLFSMRSLFTAASYHSFDEVQRWMHGVETSHPDLAKVINYGMSGAGRPLLALHVNKGTAVKPVLMITAATHGDELITTEILMSLIDQLIAGDGVDMRLTAMLDKHDLYFVPVLNPDGFTATRRFDGNADPNRSYPWPDHENAVPTPSIAGIMHLYDMIHPAGSLDYHAYGGMIMFPWAYTYSPIPQSFATPFDALTTSMAATNSYAHGPISDVIYIAPGSSADYYFWKSNCVSFAIEVGQEKIPDPSEIPTYVHDQTESLWRFIEAF